jgi:N-acetylmuramoyl-L-alanine amidase
MITAQTPVFKKIKFLCIHCTATPEGRDMTAKQIKDYHTLPVAKGGRGWKTAGYVDVIRLDGSIENIVPYDDNEYMESREITNGVLNMNSITRSFVYVGGMSKDMKQPKDTRTEAQNEAMAAYIKKVIEAIPDILVAGHNQFAAKACPSFDTVRWLRSIGIADKNIYKK